MFINKVVTYAELKEKLLKDDYSNITSDIIASE
jgi:hypothetical protein